MEAIQDFSRGSCTTTNMGIIERGITQSTNKNKGSVEHWTCTLMSLH